jgi:hypothetical protein
MNAPQDYAPTEELAWVVFSGQADMAWLRILKPGFRHCYVLLNDGHHWLSIDPLSSHTDVRVHHLPAAFDLPLWLQDRGYKIVGTRIERRRKEAPWGLFTCVEAVKRVLGLHKRFIITPWQLYRHLVKHQQ